MPSALTADRRLIDKLIREIVHVELQASEHAARETKRLGGEVPPVAALREVAAHAAVMRARFFDVLAAHELRLGRNGIGATLATLRHVVVDRVMDAERAFRTALLELRHGLEIVKLLRDAARREEVFGVIRWCDDWLGARRTLVARVEAQLAWYAEQENLDRFTGSGSDDDWHADRTT